MKKQLLLTSLALLLLCAFFLLPENRQWAGVVISYGNQFQFQRKALDSESRFRKRFGPDYTLSKAIADSLHKKGHSAQETILLPPTNYFKKAGINYHVPEPAVFYYFTGLKTTWANSSSASSADWIVRVNNGKILVEKVKERKNLLDSIDSYQKMGVSL